MSMFDNIMLDEFTMLDEGKQADEYRARKAKENDKAEKADFKHSKDRSMRKAASELAKGRSEEDVEDNIVKNMSRAMASSKTARKHFSNANTLDQNDPKNLPNDVKKQGMKSALAMAHAADAIDRHDRRKAKRSAKTESALMLIAGYDSEFAY